MFKKLLSISTAILLFATGLAVVAAAPANAAPTYTSNPGSVVSSVTFAYPMTTTGTAATFTLPSGVTTFDMNVGFSVGSTSTTAARTKALRATFELRDPSNNVISLSSQGSNVFFYDGVNQISNGGGSSYLSSAESRQVPNNATRIDVSFYGYRLTPSSGTAFASGTYSLTPSISFDNTVLPLSTTSTALTLESYSRASSYGTATSFTNPSVTLLSVFQRIGTCVDTSLVTAGNVLTATTSNNGSDSNPESVRFYNLSTGASRTFGSTHTLTVGDLTSGIIAVASQSIPATSDLAVTSDISLTVGGVEVSKRCLGTPSTPSLALSGSSLTGTVNNSTSTDGYTCNFMIL